MKEQTSIVLMNFSGIYEEERFWKERLVFWIDAKDICGTNCYCDDEAIAEINKRTENHSFAGIHFIDSGNYHYMTKLWLTKIKKPFALLVYDNHTDMQPPAFGGILSCGGWIAASLEELKNLEHVILIGPDEAAYEQVEEELKEKVIFLSREKLQEMNDAEISRFLTEVLCETLPLYISIDKDVLCPDDAQTTWSQGDMSLTELKSCLEELQSFLKARKLPLQAADVCGEWEPENGGEGSPAGLDLANHELLEVLKGFDYEK